MILKAAFQSNTDRIKLSHSRLVMELIRPTGVPGSNWLSGTTLSSDVYATAGLPSASFHPILTVAMPAALPMYTPLINGPVIQAVHVRI